MKNYDLRNARIFINDLEITGTVKSISYAPQSRWGRFRFWYDDHHLAIWRWVMRVVRWLEVLLVTFLAALAWTNVWLVWASR